MIYAVFKCEMSYKFAKIVKIYDIENKVEISYRKKSHIICQFYAIYMTFE